MTEKMVDIVFVDEAQRTLHRGPPDLRFIEVERDGKSIKYGEWIQREDGYTVLRVPDGESR